ncbi:alcohol oxidase [Podospora fimiseda]|uniref:Alcohol oxidase n=1 Tax=Podospora fimiseda TaxID=252190 RepID=A0AAN7BPB8_9PEZI|nr:alcohol oxidase [Podospora fimiseda]
MIFFCLVSKMLLIHLFLIALLAVAATALNARHVQHTSDLRKSYDFIIIGGGTAGLTIGDRLSELSKFNVLVIEHGGFINASRTVFATPSYNVTSVPQVGLNNRVTSIQIGFGVGGSSAINGQAVMRATKRDYDIWAELGNKGSTWNWNGLLPYFRKAIHFIPPKPLIASDYNITYDIEAAWGQDNNTRLYASFPGPYDPRLKTQYAALKTVPNLSVVRDGHAGVGGIYWFPVSIDELHTQERSYSRTAHWDGLNRPNYHLLINSKVSKILLDQSNRAIGVQFTSTQDNKKHTIKASKEVILSAGAIHTPQILQLSGIGSSSLLKAAKIPLKVNLHGVGYNFQDHPIGPPITFNFTHPPPIPSTNSSSSNSSFPTLYGGLVALLNLPLITSPSTASSLATTYKSQSPISHLPRGTHPDIISGYKAQQSLLSSSISTPVPPSSPQSLSMLNFVVGTSPSVQPIGMRILSRGTVLLNISYLFMYYILWYRKFYNLPYFAPYKPIEILPGTNITTRAQFEQYIRQGLSPQGWHPIGTAAKMRRSLGGVVDDSLKVYGTKGLRVADTSIFPTLPGGTTQLSVYAIAEKVSDMIKNDWK